MSSVDLRAVVRLVAALEGSTAPHEAQNRNRDGQGLSFGLIQWTQRSGNLGELLATLKARDPAAWDALTQGAGDELLRVTQAKTDRKSVV